MDTVVNEMPALDLTHLVQEVDGESAAELAAEAITEAAESRIESAMPLTNRAQRRALMRKMGKKNYNNAFDAIQQTALKINYMKLVEDIRKLNEKNKNEGVNDNEGSEEDN